jgi:hypothetical protein
MHKLTILMSDEFAKRLKALRDIREDAVKDDNAICEEALARVAALEKEGELHFSKMFAEQIAVNAVIEETEEGCVTLMLEAL